jgi:hypothetical protein
MQTITNPNTIAQDAVSHMIFVSPARYVHHTAA